MCNVRRSHSIDSLVSYNDIGAWKLKVAKQTASILVDPHDIVRGHGLRNLIIKVSRNTFDIYFFICSAVRCDYGP
jgi:hypothetical protein